MGGDMRKLRRMCLPPCGAGSTSEKRRSGRGPTKTPGSTIRALLAVAGVLSSAGCLAQDPDVGAWRKVSDSRLERQFHFSMLPRAAAVGSRWAVYDAATGKVVCCLSVASAEISESELESRFDIPGPWVTDLTNGWNLDAAPYRPHVQMLEVQGALGSHVFEATGGANGGLLLPAGAHGVGVNALEMSGKRYSLQRSEHALADDDGGVLTYVLTPLGGGTVLKVEVPFGTY